MVLPTGEGLTLPVETRNLAGVVVEVTRIYGDNMLQFLQVNDLAGDEELYRTGEVVWRKAFDLPWSDARRNQWTARLDLGPLLAKHVDGMFRIRLTFLRDQVRYVCKTDHDFQDLIFPTLDTPTGAGTGTGKRGTSIGTIPATRPSTRGSQGRTGTSSGCRTWPWGPSGTRTGRPGSSPRILTARPILDLPVILYNFQRRELTRGRTDKDGFVLPGFPGSSAAAASRGGQSAHSKLDLAGSATSHFDTGALEASTGVKGFLYGERVWRPGDEMHLTFLALDRLRTLPRSTPCASSSRTRWERWSRLPSSEGTDGFYRYTARTAEDAPTGTYLARVTVGARVFTRNVKVETIVPNRLKIEFALRRWGSTSGLARTPVSPLKSQWLHSAPAPGLKSDVSVAFPPPYPRPSRGRGTTSSRTPPAAWPRSARPSSTAASTPPGPRPSPRPSTPHSPPRRGRRPSSAVRVLEPSGILPPASSSRRPSTPPPWWECGPAGWKPDGEPSRPTRTRLVQSAPRWTGDGKPVSAQNLEPGIHRIRENWWREGGEDSLPEYARSIFERPVAEGQATVRDGRGTWTFKITQADSRGIYLIRVRDPASDHAASRVFWVSRYDWCTAAPGKGGALETLTLTASQERYEAGQEGPGILPVQPRGRALITVERSGRVLSQSVAGLRGRDHHRRIRRDRRDEPQRLRSRRLRPAPHAGRGNDLPIRPLRHPAHPLVDDPSTRLTPVIEVPEKLSRPTGPRPSGSGRLSGQTHDRDRGRGGRGPSGNHPVPHPEPLGRKVLLARRHRPCGPGTLRLRHRRIFREAGNPPGPWAARRRRRAGVAAASPPGSRRWSGTSAPQTLKAGRGQVLHHGPGALCGGCPGHGRGGPLDVGPTAPRRAPCP
ncbi:MAG: hypothetical protein MZW92_17030 [Comamonadaceae bacterium]|nr:hypothetical protein [Comamonadaceae bacterium]